METEASAFGTWSAIEGIQFIHNIVHKKNIDYINFFKLQKIIAWQCQTMNAYDFQIVRGAGVDSVVVCGWEFPGIFFLRIGSSNELLIRQ